MMMFPSRSWCAPRARFAHEARVHQFRRLLERNGLSTTKEEGARSASRVEPRPSLALRALWDHLRGHALSRSRQPDRVEPLGERIPIVAREHAAATVVDLGADSLGLPDRGDERFGHRLDAVD